MNTIQKRFLLFIFGCILVRISFVLIAKNIDKDKLPILGTLAILPAVGFLFIFIGGYRKQATFGQKVWWNDLRPVHALLYFTFVYLAFHKNEYSYIPLFLDVLIGFISFVFYHYQNDNFKKIMGKIE